MSLFLRERERESGVGSALELLIIDLVYSGSLVCGLVYVLSLRCILLLQRTILYILDD